MNGVHVRVRAGGEHYALPVEGVREIVRHDRITPVPGAPDAVLGVWSLRGDVIVALDLAAMLGLDSPGGDGCIVVAQDGGIQAGLTVEEVLEVEVLTAAVEPAASELLEGAALVDQTPVGVVDLGAVLGAAAAVPR